MKIRKLLALLDERQVLADHNDIFRWLSILDGNAKENVFDTHEGFEKMPAFVPYAEGETDEDTKLLIPFPYDEIYLYWVLSRYYYEQNEIAKYNNANSLYSELWNEWVRKVNREYMPKTKAKMNTYKR